MVAIYGLTQSFLQLRRVLRVAKLDSVSFVVRSSLRRAQRLAAAQVIGVSSSLMFTTLAFASLCIAYFHLTRHGWVPTLQAYILNVLMALDFLGNATAVILLSGSHRLHADSHLADRQRSRVEQLADRRRSRVEQRILVSIA